MPSFKFPDSGGGGGLAALLINNTVFVSKNGNDATGVRNDWSKPFLTIQAGLAAALAGDTVYVFPGTYVEALVMPDGKNNIRLVGAGMKEVIVAPAAGVPFTWTILAAGMTQFEMADLALVSPGGGGGATCLVIDGNAVVDAASAFPGFTFRNLLINDNEPGNAVDFRRLTDARFYDCVIPQGDFRMRNVGRLNVHDCELPRPFEHYDVAEVQPTGGRADHYYLGCAMGAFRLEGHPKVNIDRECVIRGSFNNAILSVGAGPTPPVVRCQARCEFAIAITMPVPAAGMEFDFSDSVLVGDVLFVNPGPARFTVKLNNAVLQQTGALGSQIRGGDFIDYDCFGASYDTAAIFVDLTGAPDGLGVRRNYTTSRIVVPAGPGGPFPIIPPWSGSVPVPKVFTQINDAVAANIVSVPVGGVTRHLFGTDSTVGGGVDAVVKDSLA